MIYFDGYKFVADLVGEMHDFANLNGVSKKESRVEPYLHYITYDIAKRKEIKSNPKVVMIQTNQMEKFSAIMLVNTTKMMKDKMKFDDERKMADTTAKAHQATKRIPKQFNDNKITVNL